MTDEQCPQCKVLTEKIERFKERGRQRERADLELQMRLYAFAVLLGMEPDRDTTYIEVVDRAEAEIKRLREIVDQLPKTADGVPVAPGMYLYTPAVAIAGRVARGAWKDIVGSMEPISETPETSIWQNGGMDPGRCYSTREAAEAAKDATETQTPP